MEGSFFAIARSEIARWLAANSPSSVTTTASMRPAAIAAKAVPNSVGVATLNCSTLIFRLAGTDFLAVMIGLLTGLFGFDRAAILVTVGKMSFSHWSRLALS